MMLSSPNSPKTCLVTGGAGFIGSQLCKALLSLGHRVVSLDNLDPYYSINIKLKNINDLTALAPERFSFIRGDIRENADLELAWAQGPFDLVFHLAAKAGVRPSISKPVEYVDVNLSGTVKLLEMMRKNGPRKLVFASSSSVYGDGEEKELTEDLVADTPASPYAATKRSGELICHSWHHLYGFDITALRFFTVYGPGQRPEMAIHKFARLMRSGEPVPVFGAGDTTRDYTFISDIVEGIILAAENLGGFRIYNLGGGSPIRLMDLIDILASSLGITPVLDFLPLQDGDVAHTRASVALAAKELGFKTKTEFREGIDKFVAWFKQVADLA